jgi:hypothetical protein
MGLGERKYTESSAAAGTMRYTSAKAWDAWRVDRADISSEDVLHNT